MEHHPEVAEKFFIAGAKIPIGFYNIKPLTEGMIYNAYDNAKFATLIELLLYYFDEAPYNGARVVIGNLDFEGQYLLEVITGEGNNQNTNLKTQAGLRALRENEGDYHKVFSTVGRIGAEAKKFYKSSIIKEKTEEASANADPAAAADGDLQHLDPVECTSDFVGDGSNDVVDLG